MQRRSGLSAIWEQEVRSERLTRSVQAERAAEEEYDVGDKIDSRPGFAD